MMTTRQTFRTSSTSSPALSAIFASMSLVNGKRPAGFAVMRPTVLFTSWTSVDSLGDSTSEYLKMLLTAAGIVLQTTDLLNFRDLSVTQCLIKLANVTGF